MTQPPQPTEPFAQHPRLAELVTALGFRRYPLFLTGLLYQEPGGPLRRATAVASRDRNQAFNAHEVAGWTKGRRSVNEVGIELLHHWSCSPQADPGRFTMSEAAERS